MLGQMSLPTTGVDFAAVVSYLSCRDILRLAAASRSIHALRLEQGLLTLEVFNLPDARLCQHFIDWARQCKKLLALDMQFAGIQGQGIRRWAFPAGAVIEGIITKYKHLLSVDLKECDFMTDQAVDTLARHCPSLIQIALGTMFAIGPDISDAAVYSIAQHCRPLLSVDLDDTEVRKPWHLPASDCGTHPSVQHTSLQSGRQL